MINHKLFRLLALLALALVIVPPAAFLLGLLVNEAVMKTVMLVGTVLWFITAPLWLRPPRTSSPPSPGS